jgi:hypothetical protein
LLIIGLAETFEILVLKSILFVSTTEKNKTASLLCAISCVERNKKPKSNFML